MVVQFLGVIPSIVHSSMWSMSKGSNHSFDATHVGRMHVGMRVLNYMCRIDCSEWCCKCVSQCSVGACVARLQMIAQCIPLVIANVVKAR